MPSGVEIANAYVALQVKMPGAARDIAVELGRAAPATASVGRNIGSSILSGVGSVLKGGAVALGTVAGAAIGTALFKGFQRLDAIDTARAKLTGLGNDAATVQAVMGNALAAVKGTAFGLGDASTVAAQLVAAQIKPGEQLEGVMKSVANSAAAAGTGIGEMGSIYAKVASVGKAQNDSLQQVAQRGIPIYQELARSLGVSTDEVFKLASDGKINFEQFSAAMTSAAGTVASEMGGTVKGSWANFIASLGRIGAGLMSGLFPKVAPAIQAMTKALGPLEEIAAEVGTSIATWLSPAIDNLTTKIAAVDFRQVYQAAIDIKDLLGTGFTENELSAMISPEAADRLQFAHNSIAGIYDLVVKGDFTSKLRDAFGFEEDSGFVTFVLGARDAIGSFFSSLTSGDFSGAASSIGTSLQTLSPALSDFGAQLPKVGQAAAKITAGGVDVLTQVLSFLADNVDTIIQFMPLIVAGFIAWRVAGTAVANATLALRTAELMATPVYFANNVMRNNSVRIERELALAKAASSGATNVAAAATARGTIATLAASTASRVAAAGQWLLNAALSANPIGIIILAITALVGALVWFFTQTELGQQLWAGFATGVATLATWLYENVLQPVFNGIGVAFAFLWQGMKPIFDFIVGYYRFWGAVAVWLWENVLAPGFAKIGEVFVWLYQNVIAPIVANIVGQIRLWGAIFGWLYDTIVQPVFNGIMNVLGTGYAWLRDNVFSPLGTAIDSIGRSFEVVGAAIAVAWEGIKRSAADPINFVLDTIWNNGLRSFWNDLVRTLKIEDMALPAAPLIKFASGGVLPGYTPGRDVHQFWSATAGGLALSGGEAIMRPEFARLVGGPAGVDALNAAAISGRLPFGDGPGMIAGDVLDSLAGIAAIAWEFLTNPDQAIQKRVVDGIISPMAADQNLFGRTVAGLASNTLKSMSGIFPSAPAAAGSAGMGWEAMWRVVQAGIPGAVLTSAARPGAVTANGGQSYHALGRAIDLIPASMATFNAVASMFPNASELIYSPAGKRQLLNGQPFDGWSDAVRAQHFNHVHLAMANGGVLPKLYDQGGWLPHGGMAINMSGRPEPILTGDQWDAMKNGGMPSEIVVRDVDGVLVGRMKVEAADQVRAAAEADDRAWAGGRKSP
ncbi:tape measure protein [Microbacterium sp. CFBP 13617]|uniref:tape measure protein n=1 Tax=Microbacterium sp. CFBP 13617 TaxID=2774035 RepID=UPI001785DDCE|nr:tape measure protein [Microbacterium sp. CFBP 13617]MBD8218197.1 tape measure protein [Microbacterium sp. CFBP 13617]